MQEKRIDCAYVEQRLAIELDDLAHHAGSRTALNYDRARPHELEALGWSFRRFTWDHVTLDPVMVVATTASALGLFPTRWAACDRVLVR
jgi:very-short-patch-repair endonuclease